MKQKSPARTALKDLTLKNKAMFKFLRKSEPIKPVLVVTPPSEIKEIPSPPRRGLKWEYEVIHIAKTDTTHGKAELNRLGWQGWEAYDIISLYSQDANYQIFLKRRIE